MFRHIFAYGFKSLLRTREIIFWTLIFPFALTTFMYLAFSNLFETTEKFDQIPVAVVQEKENKIFEEMIKAVSGEKEDRLLEVRETSYEEAKALLADEDIKGVLLVGDSVSLEVAESGMDQTLLQMILDQFVQYKKVIGDVAQVQPERLMQVISEMTSQTDYYVETNSNHGNQDNVMNFFYAILAMVCLFASFAGCDKIMRIQANASVLGQRRNVAPTHKMKNILADFAACEVVQFSISVLSVIYMKYVLKLELGDKLPAIFLLLFVGTSYGIMLGILVGSLPKFGEGAKMGILVAACLAMCAISDLMISGIKDAIEHTVPIINDINPAALITDSFYALNIYDGYGRFMENMLLLGGGAIILMIICYFMIRRSRYASL